MTGPAEAAVEVAGQALQMAGAVLTITGIACSSTGPWSFGRKNMATVTISRGRYRWNRVTSIAFGASMLYIYEHRRYLGWDAVVVVGGAVAVSFLLAYLWLRTTRTHLQEK